jgi:hypothetical protein
MDKWHRETARRGNEMAKAEKDPWTKGFLKAQAKYIKELGREAEQRAKKKR